MENLYALGATSKLRRGDIVELPMIDMFMPGRVWRRIDENHVQVIDDGKHISIFREDHLKLSDYKGRWAWQRHPGNDYGRHPKWIPMTSLKRLKKDAADYNDHFGGLSAHGYKRTRADRLDALANREISNPHLLITDIVWDREVDGVTESTTLPEVVILRNIEEDNIADELSDLYGFCVKSFIIDRSRPFPGSKGV